MTNRLEFLSSSLCNKQVEWLLLVSSRKSSSRLLNQFNHGLKVTNN